LKKPITIKGLVEWLKLQECLPSSCEALSPNPRAAKKKKKKKTQTCMSVKRFIVFREWTRKIQVICIPDMLSLTSLSFLSRPQPFAIFSGWIGPCGGSFHSSVWLSQPALGIGDPGLSCDIVCHSHHVMISRGAAPGLT
jgi:hypothetical protein